MTDSFRYIHNEKSYNQYTWWNYRSMGYIKNYGLRIDYALISNSLKNRISSSSILKKYREMDNPSDHAPIKIIIE